MSAQPYEYLSLQQYFELEATSEIKHEYYRGATYAITGASARHNLIVANIIGLLHSQLRGSPCRVFPSDLRLKIEQTGLYTYPDVSVICGTIQFDAGRQDTVTNPSVLIEVLSPRTENYDRGKKFEHYRTIETLQVYIVVAQDRMHIEQYIRQDEHRWLLVDFFTPEQVLQIDTTDCNLPLADVYEYISFEDDDQ